MQIKAHPFFRGIDWDALLRKEVSPPWVPKVTNSEDVSLISPQWTDRVPRVRGLYSPQLHAAGVL
jgi:hypothetical protein